MTVHASASSYNANAQADPQANPRTRILARLIPKSEKKEKPMLSNEELSLKFTNILNNARRIPKFKPLHSPKILLLMGKYYSCPLVDNVRANLRGYDIVHLAEENGKQYFALSFLKLLPKLGRMDEQDALALLLHVVYSKKAGNSQQAEIDLCKNLLENVSQAMQDGTVRLAAIMARKAMLLRLKDAAHVARLYSSAALVPKSSTSP